MVKKISSAEISAVYAALTIGLPTDKIPPLIFSSVSVYKLTYKTSYPGETNKVLASGALVVPDQTNSKPILSYQHGTITDPNQIPSLFASTSQNGYAAVLGGLGFYVSVPDYLGYGDNKAYHHLYEHGASLASASYDMLLASRAFLLSNDHKVDDKLVYTTIVFDQYLYVGTNQGLFYKKHNVNEPLKPIEGLEGRGFLIEEEEGDKQRHQIGLPQN